MAIAILGAFVALPMAKAICDVTCLEAAYAHVMVTDHQGADSMSEHHHGMAHSSAPAEAGAPSLTSLPAHKCGAADDALLQSEVAAPQRSDANTPVARASVLVSGTSGLLPLRLIRSHPPRFVSRSASTPVVLRV